MAPAFRPRALASTASTVSRGPPARSGHQRCRTAVVRALTGNPPLPPPHRQLGTAGGAGLGHRMREVFLHGADRNSEPASDLTVRQPLGHELRDQLLARGESPFAGRRLTAGRGRAGYGMPVEAQDKLPPESADNLLFTTVLTVIVPEAYSK